MQTTSSLYLLNTHKTQLHIDWPAYSNQIVALFLKIKKSGWTPDFLMAIGGQGLILGNACSRLFGKNIGVVMASSQGELAEQVSVVNQALKNKGLLLDVESTRLEKTKENILQKFPEVTEIKTAAIFQRALTTLPTHFLEGIEEDTNIVLPDEIFDHIDITKIQSLTLAKVPDEALFKLGEVLFGQMFNNVEKKLSSEAVDRLVEQFITNQSQLCFKSSNEVQSSIMDVSWTDYGKKILTLTLKIIKSNWMPDFIISIGRGGVAVGDACSRLMHRPVGVIMASSYKEEGPCARGKLNIAEHVSALNALEGKGLLIDDLVDSGTTLEKTKEEILKRYPKIQEVKTGVIFQKTATKVMPDYHAEIVSEKRWIFLPDEIFERMNLKSIKAEHLQNLSDASLSMFANAILQNVLTDPSKKLTDKDVEELVSKFY